MVKLNQNYDKLQAGYLFPEIARRTRVFQQDNPDAQVFKLGIGDTTLPLPISIVKGLDNAVHGLGNAATYSGYGNEQGQSELRQAIADRYQSRFGVGLDVSEIFVSDGAKPDTANLQSIFGLESIVAIPDPVYPVYLDTNVIAGRTGEFSDGRFGGVVYMPCNENNGFVPGVPFEKADIFYLCSPNNPTGAVMDKEYLYDFVNYVRDRKAVIIFDSAYESFIQEHGMPHSIYEVEGAKECAIEVNSFSKMAGFTGVRLGWTVVPKDLVVEGSKPGQANNIWNRRQSTFFNGASNISQAGGLAALSPEGQQDCQEMVRYYMQNAAYIKAGLEGKGLKVYGGRNAPYLWMKTPDGMTSWDFFDEMLNEAHVVGTPGSGFGREGEGFFRLSAFGSWENVRSAMESIKENLKL